MDHSTFLNNWQELSGKSGLLWSSCPVHKNRSRTELLIKRTVEGLTRAGTVAYGESWNITTASVHRLAASQGELLFSPLFPRGWWFNFKAFQGYVNSRCYHTGPQNKEAPSPLLSYMVPMQQDGGRSPDRSHPSFELDFKGHLRLGGLSWFLQWEMNSISKTLQSSLYFIYLPILLSGL